MRFYNTLHKKIEDFIPRDKNNVTMYTCGPTVYHYAHIGNLRTYILEDILEKTLNFCGYHVNRVMNITDVGHLTSDGDEGEDKMSVASKREHKSSLEIADFYTQAFFSDLEKLNLKKPETIIKASDTIDEYIKIISDLLEKGFAYKSNGNVYFDTAKMPNYYELSGRNKEDLVTAVRDDIKEDDGKKNQEDFGLWFTNSKFENPELVWDSPFGKGYPGWHIECSGISIKYLGEYLDIHCGAEDAVFPHHTNEIAQSEAYLGHKWCNYWLHLSFLNLNNLKMSKSTGEFITIDTLIKKGYDPLAYKYFVLNGYYHKQLDFTYENLDIAQKSYKRLKNKVLQLENTGNIDLEIENEYINKFKDALNNDLNTANALSLIYDVLKINVSDVTKRSIIAKMDEVLGLSLLETSEKKMVDKEIMDLINKRNEYKKQKNFQKADEIRDELLSRNIRLIDTREGTTYEIIK